MLDISDNVIFNGWVEQTAFPENWTNEDMRTFMNSKPIIPVINV